MVAIESKGVRGRVGAELVKCASQVRCACGEAKARRAAPKAWRSMKRLSGSTFSALAIACARPSGTSRSEPDRRVVALLNRLEKLKVFELLFLVDVEGLFSSQGRVKDDAEGGLFGLRGRGLPMICSGGI